MTARSVAARGPVLHYRGERDGRRLYAVTVAEGTPVSLGGERLATTPIGRLGDLAFASVRFEVPEGAGWIAYRAGDVEHAFFVGADAVRLAYTSCNGGEDEDAARAYPTGRNAMWRDLLAAHERDPFSVLVMGGDQIYADAVLRQPAFAAWRAMGRSRWEAPFTREMKAEAEAFFANRYGEVWREPEVAEALATIPTVMMWDDHDISDGWGSYPDPQRLSPVAQGLFAVARRAFALFQLGVDPDEPGAPFEGVAHFGWTADCGPARLVVPDLRSERRLDRVMGADHRVIEEGMRGDRHKLVVSSVPLVNVDLSRAERLLRRIGWHKYTDDLRDQWMSYAHRGEWRRVMARLLDASRTAPVTVLSGEIHLAALGTALRGADSVAQYIASGIAHPPPPKAWASLLGRLTGNEWRRDDIALRMQPLGETGRRYIAERNWLEVGIGPDGKLSATLHGEEAGAVPLTA